MQKRITAGFMALSAGVVVLAFGHEPALAQPKGDKAAPPKFLYGHDLRVRKGGEKFFDANTPRVGVEVFQYEVAGSDGKAVPFNVAISETGSLATFPAGTVGADKTCKWLTAHDLKVRKAGELEFTQKTKMFGVELFRDQGSNRLLYVCESGSIAVAPVPGSLVTDKGPKWHHALEPKVRGPEEDRFDNAKKFGLEVFKDENTGGLIYITETGAIATSAAPAAAPASNKIAPPKPAYGLVLRVRGAEELDFTEKTKKMGVEVFEDPNANTLLYVSEAGSVAVVPNTSGGKFGDTRGVTWLTAMNLRARKAGEKEFEKAKKFGIEIFLDNRTGNLIFICETGAIAVLPK